MIARRTANYGAPGASDSNAVDLHNKEFCVDVSTYLPVEWQEVEAEQCDTVFVKQCEDREEDVCAEVTETRCQVRRVRKVNDGKLTSLIISELSDLFRLFLIKHTYSLTSIYQVSLYYQKHAKIPLCVYCV